MAWIGPYGTYQAGKAQKATMDYNAKLAENEAIAKEQQIRSETERMRMQKSRVLSSQRAAYGKSGAVVSEGTPLLTMAEEVGLMELDILQMQRTGAMQAGASRSEARLSRFQGKSMLRAAKIQATSEFISNLTSMASQGGGGA